MKRSVDKTKLLVLLRNEVNKFQEKADKLKERGSHEAALNMELAKYRILDLVTAVEMGILDETIWSEDDE